MRVDLVTGVPTCALPISGRRFDTAPKGEANHRVWRQAGIGGQSLAGEDCCGNGVCLGIQLGEADAPVPGEERDGLRRSIGKIGKASWREGEMDAGVEGGE